MQLKVCGMKYEDNINEVLTKVRPNYMGYIFYPKSPRFVTESTLPDNILQNKGATKFIGIFVNETVSKILDMVKTFPLDGVQLHGSETPETCAQLKQNTTVWKAFGVDETFDFDTLEPYEPYVDAFLFDTKSSKHGGTGKVFDWRILNQYKSNKPYILSGGVYVDNYNDIKTINKQPFMIDVNSKFETAPALKNVATLLELKNIL
jgi:phosphoribosylanthranilate isomerase